MTYFEAYLLTRLDALNVLGRGCLFFGIMISLMAFIVYCANQDPDDDKEVIMKTIIQKIFKFSIPVLLLGIFLATFTPTTKEAAFIYIAPAIVNNEDLQKTVKQLPELSNLGMEYLNGLLKKEIKEGK